MNVIFIHYHLNRGGVTQVLAHHLRAILQLDSAERPKRLAVVFGGRSDGILEPLIADHPDLPVELANLPALDYDAEIPSDAVPLIEALPGWLQSQGYQPEETILHVHNHSLGKNAALRSTLHRLANEGYRLLLHIHDFAEDYRPTNYRALRDSLGEESFGSTYPQATQIHYAVLNRRDRSILSSAGTPEERLHWLPNPAPSFTNLPGPAEARRALEQQFPQLAGGEFWLYPVRGIRRKNLGEPLLWSVVASNLHVGFTLPPTNPVEIPHYTKWKQFAADLNLPCLFELGLHEQLGFQQLLAAADAILTTSVAEGFGLVFLEAFLAGKQLVGRDLPEITSDFKQAGLKFPFLSPTVRIPSAWFGRDAILQALRAVEVKLCRDYELPTDEQTEAQLTALCQTEAIDFSHLSSELQRSTIQHVTQDPKKRAELLHLNPAMEQAFYRKESEGAVQANANLIQQHYTLLQTGLRLREIYQQLLEISHPLPSEPLAHAELIRKAFLSPQRLFPIRLEES